jgi:hypothetical protein
MKIYRKVRTSDNPILSLFSSWINRKYLNLAKKATKALSDEYNGMRFYLCDMFDSYYILSSREVNDFNEKMSKDKRMQFDELMRACLYYVDKNGEFMK